MGVNGIIGNNKVYPRVCGGYLLSPEMYFLSTGLSPRVRGIRLSTISSKHFSGSIPACAGDTSMLRRQCAECRVYPRVCGGYLHDMAMMFARKGLSPRVRGILFSPKNTAGIPRSIPACAGDTAIQRATAGSSGVYPRVCGGYH